MAMRVNRLKELLKADDSPLFGAFLNFPTSREVEFIGHLGFDWVLLDAEHDGLSVERAYELIIAADNVGLGTVIRIPANTPDQILAFAETGANSLIVPHIMSADAARHLVDAITFPPKGRRGLGAGSRAANYGLTQTGKEYFAAESHAMPAALLEDVEAYDDIDEILAIDGLDILCLGTGDLSGSLGIPGESAHPSVVERARAATEKILAAGKHISSAAGDGESARKLAEQGHRLIQCTNTGLLGRAAREYLSEARG